MPINSESLNRKLYDLLTVRGYNPKPLDTEGKVTPVPEEAAVMKFDFIKDGKNYGQVWISIDGSKTLQVYYGDAVADSSSDKTDDASYDDTWTGLIRHLKNWAQRRQLGFELKNENHLAPDMARRSHTAKKEKISEESLPKIYHKTKGVAEGKIKEIRYADKLDDSEYSTDNLLKVGKVVGQIENNDVMMASDGTEKVYFLVVDGEVTAFLGFKNGKLTNIKNFTNAPGVVRALIGYLVHKEGKKIKISADEQLTTDGIKWLIHLTKSPRGLNIQDQTGNPADSVELKKEWNNAKKTGTPGPTSITISENAKFGNKLRENEERRQKSSLLMPFNLYEIPTKKTTAQSIKKGVAEGKQEYKLNLESIEKQFGEIKLTGGVVRNNQPLLRFLAKNGISSEVFDHLIEQKIGKVMKDKTITESIDKKDKNLNHIFSQFNNFSTGNKVKVGDSVSVLSLEALSLSNNTIELTGFLKPQTITNISDNYVEFESGETFPKQRIIQTRMLRQVIFFHNVEQAKKCLTVMSLHSGKTGDWEFSIDVADADNGSSKQGVAEESLKEKEYKVIASMGDHEFEMDFKAKTEQGALMQAKKWQKQNHIKDVVFTVKEQGVAEMDNRTLSGDRKEQRANSPEAIAQREKEQQANLKKVSPEMRKKLRLPDPDKEDMAEGSDYTPPKLGTVKANLMLSQKPTVQVKVFKHNTLRGDSYWVTKEVRTFKTMDQAQAYVDRINKQGIAEGQETMKQVSEGYYPMGKQGSYSDAVPTTKIIIQHSRKIEEGEQRYRNIAKIFVENTQGERFAVPTIKPGIARVYARHIAEGGTPYDERGKHITSLVEEYSKMAGFVRATKGKQFNESAQQLVNEGINHYQSLRESLRKMTGHRGYMAYFESYTPTLVEDGEEQPNLNELFVQETLDPRIESVMPILSKLHKKVSEMREVGALAEWADSLTKLDEEQVEEEYTGSAEELLNRPGAAKALAAANREKIRNAKLAQKAMFAPSPKPAKPKIDLEKVAIDFENVVGQVFPDGDPLDYMIPKLKRMGIDQYDVGKVLDQAARKYLGAKSYTDYLSNMWDDNPEARGSQEQNPWRSNESEELEEDLDANQKRAGQLGPTEKVGPEGAVGKLVGTSESIELSEMDSQDDLAAILRIIKK